MTNNEDIVEAWEYLNDSIQKRALCAAEVAKKLPDGYKTSLPAWPSDVHIHYENAIVGSLDPFTRRPYDVEQAIAESIQRVEKEKNRVTQRA